MPTKKPAKKKPVKNQVKAPVVQEMKIIETPVKVKVVKKEETQKKTQSSIFSKPLPLYLCIMLIVAGLLVGVVASYKLFPQQECGECTVIGAEDKKVDVTLLYSDDCELCEKYHSILDVFGDRAIPYNLTEVEASSVEGKTLIAKYNVTELPSAIINYEKMSLYPTTATGISQKFDRILDSYVANEINFNMEKFYASKFIDGSVSDSNKISVIFFDDPLSKVSILNRGFIKNALEKLSGEIEFDYVYWLTETLTPEKLETAKYLKCAQEQGKYLEMERQIRALSCNIDFNAEIISEQDISYCTSGLGNIEPLSFAELDEIRSKVELDSVEFDSCTENFETRTEKWEDQIFAYGIQKRSLFSIALVDYTYLVNVQNLEDAICASDSSLSACSPEGTA